jgi:hypothetical protein
MNQQQMPQNDFSTWVRNYIHYDNLAGNYSKQATGARKLRDEFETKVIQNLRSNSMENAVIQVSGARLQYAEDKSLPSLSPNRLQQYLHKYYAQRGNGLDETDAIMRFINLQREQECTRTACLKKTPVQAAIPPPPPPPSQIPTSSPSQNYSIQHTQQQRFA